MQSLPQPTPAIISWSGGKDSCLALHEMIKLGQFRVEALMTTITSDFGRISMHGVRTELLERQARSLGYPLHPVYIRKSASNVEYEHATSEAFSEYRKRGISHVAFGDLFLEDIRAYRNEFLMRNGMTGLYPIWQRPTGPLIREFIAAGFKAVIVCVDPMQLDARFAGRIIDLDLLSELPDSCDPCGENGEFHTFVFDGPIFRWPIPFTLSEIVNRDSFCFCDVVPA